MKRYVLLLGIVSLLMVSAVEAQLRIRTGMGYGHRFQRSHTGGRQRQSLPKFQPSLQLSVGYGFPSQDKNELPEFQDYYKGNVSQNGPVTGALDYRFSRNMSVGIMVTHGEVSVPYYNYNDPYTTVFNGALNNWAFMFNLVRFMPVSSSKVSPYVRTAIGLNTWTQNYTDPSGNKITIPGIQPPDLAYQVALGAQVKLTKRTQLFAEAGYGKYIVHGGLSFRL